MPESLNVNVGILGHVDSGKTSLVKALSTSLSTAALDKHPQSQQRGITLDLGFSAFSLPLPDHLSAEHGDAYDLIQFTLVDCPGHASLIKTIIGGAQIIDMIILVVDANKGIQTQTAECIVIGEMTTDNLIIVLNKIDAIPTDDREEKLERVSKRIRAALSTTKFKDAPIVRTAAFVGGEKVAAVTDGDESAAAGASASSVSSGGAKSIGIDTLTDLLKGSVKVPARNTDKAPFYFAIDHCFPIKGHGTVLTGTVLSGNVSTNTTIELPYIQQQRKVKSMQMFRKPVKEVGQGDRVGICVTNLDAANIERGIAAAPGSVPLLSSVICMVKKVRYFREAARSNTKFHVSIGHTTVLATATFYGAKEMLSMARDKEEGGKEREAKGSSLNASYQRHFPRIPYDWDSHYEVQDELYGGETAAHEREHEHEHEEGSEESLTRTRHEHGHEPVQWALLQFQQPVYCPLGSLIIGSRLDIDTKTAGKPSKDLSKDDRDSKAGNKSCRLSFHGPIVQDFSGGDLARIKLFAWKSKEAEVLKLNDVRAGGLCYELVAHNMYSDGASVTPFVGMRVVSGSNHVGVITGSFGSGGKFKVKFAAGVPRSKVPPGSRLLLRFKRFAFDKDKAMRQFSQDFDNLKVQEQVQEKAPVRSKEKEGKERQKKEERDKEREKKEVAPPPAPAPKAKALEARSGTIDSLKEGGTVAIVSKVFTMADDIRASAGAAARGPNGEDGELVGPYAKLGKCKIRFDAGLGEAAVGATVTVTVPI